MAGPEGLPRQQSCFLRGGPLRPDPGVPPPDREAVANDAVKQQQGGDGVTYKRGKMQPQISWSPLGG